MSDRPVTYVISDLHVGGGAADPGDDHVYQDGEFCAFLKKIAADDGSRAELVINGDFLEFAQTHQEVYTLGSSRYWCSEKESVAKLAVILRGHADIFQAMREYIEQGGRVTIAAGNHDVDLYWPDVQKDIRAAAGDIQFELKRHVYPRYGGRLLIGHGHAYDNANRFDHWDEPIRKTPRGVPRLEMCRGTIFMVKFVNGLEKDYPFVDNIKPITTLARLLIKEGWRTWLPPIWSILRLGTRHPIVSLGVKDEEVDFPAMVRRAFGIKKGKFRQELTELYRDVYGSAAMEADVQQALEDEESLAEFIELLALRLEPDEWSVFKRILPRKLSAAAEASGKEPRTLGLATSRFTSEKKVLHKEAQKLIKGGAEAVVFGHTHQPDCWVSDKGAYFNPGSWTRFLDLATIEKLTLEDLKDELAFPYQLNYVRIEDKDSGLLDAGLYTFKESPGTRWACPAKP